MIEIDKARLKKLIEQGLTATQIGGILKCTAPVISQRAKKYGLFDLLKNNWITARTVPVNEKDFKAFVKKGYSTTEIALHYDCTTSTVRNYAARYGVSKELFANPWRTDSNLL